MMIPKILLGMLILIFGRQIFWLFVAVIGFAIGMSLAELFLVGSPIWIVLIIALIFGIVGALLAIFLKKIAIGFVGFMAGGYISAGLLAFSGSEIMPFFWLICLIGGGIGLFLAIMLIDWALIILSSLAGALLIVEGIHFIPLFKMLLFVFLLSAGIMIQRGMMVNERR
jgi:hypothetical protein